MSTDEAPSRVLLAEDFEEGLNLTHTWALTSIESFTADDGVVITSPSGLYVRASSTNPVTGEPAFTLSGAGELNHLKWMADTRQVSSNAYPRFDAVPGEVLCCTMWGSGQTFGTAPILSAPPSATHSPTCAWPHSR